MLKPGSGNSVPNAAVLLAEKVGDKADEAEAVPAVEVCWVFEARIVAWAITVERSGVPEMDEGKLLAELDCALESLIAPVGVFVLVEGDGDGAVVWRALEARIVAWAITVERSGALEMN